MCVSAMGIFLLSYLGPGLTETVLHCGRTVLHCGRTVLHCGRTVLHCGRTVLHCGRTVLHCGRTVLHCGRTVLHCGRTVLHCGSVVRCACPQWGSSSSCTSAPDSQRECCIVGGLCCIVGVLLDVRVRNGDLPPLVPRPRTHRDGFARGEPAAVLERIYQVVDVLVWRRHTPCRPGRGLGGVGCVGWVRWHHVGVRWCRGAPHPDVATEGHRLLLPRLKEKKNVVGNS